MMTLKKTKKNDKARHSSDCLFFETYSKGYGVDFFLNGTPKSIFAKLTIFHYIKMRKTLGKIVRKITG